MIPTEFEFYSALEKRHGKELQKKISNTSVAICGLGGLGSNIAISLARTGIGKLVLIDFDYVDITNLHRQQYFINQIGMKKTDALQDNLKIIAPYVKIDTHNARITHKNIIPLISDADIICEAFDDPDSKAMLVDSILENMPEKYLIASSGMAGIGSPNEIKTRKITNRFYLSGDGVSDVFDDIGLLASRVMLCAAHQAHTVIRIIAEKFDV